MMSLHVGLRRATPPAAIVGYSGMLVEPPDGNLQAFAAEIKARPPVLLIHGDDDRNVNFNETVSLAGFRDRFALGDPGLIYLNGNSLGALPRATLARMETVFRAEWGTALARSWDHWVDLPGTGTIYTYTIVRHPLAPQLAAVVPYVSGVIKLDGTQGAGARLLLNITDADPDTVRIGDKVQIWFDQVSDTFPLPRARMA